MKPPAASPVIQLLRVIWNNTTESGKSYQRLNAALQDGLTLAIERGFVFRRDDFIQIDKLFRPGWWMGNDESGLGERYYSRAVDGPHGYESTGRAYPNLSAAQAFEEWKERKPYIVKGRRLAIGSRVHHPEHGHLRVTSINQDEIRACLYKDDEDRKPVRRFTFTHKTIKSEGLA